MRECEDEGNGGRVDVMIHALFMRKSIAESQANRSGNGESKGKGSLKRKRAARKKGTKK